MGETGDMTKGACESSIAFAQVQIFEGTQGIIDIECFSSKVSFFANSNNLNVYFYNSHTKNIPFLFLKSSLIDN